MSVRVHHRNRGTGKPWDISHDTTFTRRSHGRSSHIVLITRQVQTKSKTFVTSIHVWTERYTFHARLHHNTILIRVRYRSHEMCILTTARYRQMVLMHTGIAQYGIQPVGVCIMVRVRAVPQFLQSLFRKSSRFYFISHQGPIIAVNIVGNDTRSLQGITTWIRNLHLTWCLSAFSSYQNNTIGCTNTVNSSRSRILQHRNTFDISRWNLRDLRNRTFYSVYQYHRIVIAECTDTTNTYFGIVITGLCTVLGQYQSRQAALQQSGGIGHRNILNILGRYRRDRTRQIDFLLGSITDHHYFV